MNLSKFVIPFNLAVAFSAIATVAQAQTFIQSGNFQGGVVQQVEVIAPQPTEEQLAKPGIGADLYDTGSSPGVRSVYTNGPAQKAGLQSGDMITKVNGKAAGTVADLNAKLASMASGDALTLTRSRDGEEQDLSVSLMTLNEIMQASIVPEPGIYDSAIQQIESRVATMKQRIKNAQQDLEDLTKGLADQEKQLGELKAKAEAAAAAAKKKKSEEKPAAAGSGSK